MHILKALIDLELARLQHAAFIPALREREPLNPAYDTTSIACKNEYLANLARVNRKAADTNGCIELQTENGIYSVLKNNNLGQHSLFYWIEQLQITHPDLNNPYTFAKAALLFCLAADSLALYLGIEPSKELFKNLTAADLEKKLEKCALSEIQTYLGEFDNFFTSGFPQNSWESFHKLGFTLAKVIIKDCIAQLAVPATTSAELLDAIAPLCVGCWSFTGIDLAIDDSSPELLKALADIIFERLLEIDTEDAQNLIASLLARKTKATAPEAIEFCKQLTTAHNKVFMQTPLVSSGSIKLDQCIFSLDADDLLNYRVVMKSKLQDDALVAGGDEGTAFLTAYTAAAALEPAQKLNRLRDSTFTLQANELANHKTQYNPKPFNGSAAYKLIRDLQMIYMPDPNDPSHEYCEELLSPRVFNAQTSEAAHIQNFATDLIRTRLQHWQADNNSICATNAKPFAIFFDNETNTLKHEFYCNNNQLGAMYTQLQSVTSSTPQISSVLPAVLNQHTVSHALFNSIASFLTQTFSPEPLLCFPEQPDPIINIDYNSQNNTFTLRCMGSYKSVKYGTTDLKERHDFLRPFNFCCEYSLTQNQFNKNIFTVTCTHATIYYGPTPIKSVAEFKECLQAELRNVIAHSKTFTPRKQIAIPAMFNAAAPEKAWIMQTPITNWTEKWVAKVFYTDPETFKTWHKLTHSWLKSADHTQFNKLIDAYNEQRNATKNQLDELEQSLNGNIDQQQFAAMLKEEQIQKLTDHLLMLQFIGILNTWFAINLENLKDKLGTFEKGVFEFLRKQALANVSSAATITQQHSHPAVTAALVAQQLEFYTQIKAYLPVREYILKQLLDRITQAKSGHEKLQEKLKAFVSQCQTSGDLVAFQDICKRYAQHPVFLISSFTSTLQKAINKKLFDTTINEKVTDLGKLQTIEQELAQLNDNLPQDLFNFIDGCADNSLLIQIHNAITQTSDVNHPYHPSQNLGQNLMTAIDTKMASNVVEIKSVMETAQLVVQQQKIEVKNQTFDSAIKQQSQHLPVYKLPSNRSANNNLASDQLLEVVIAHINAKIDDRKEQLALASNSNNTNKIGFYAVLAGDINVENRKSLIAVLKNAPAKLQAAGVAASSFTMLANIMATAPKLTRNVDPDEQLLLELCTVAEQSFANGYLMENTAAALSVVTSNASSSSSNSAGGSGSNATANNGGGLMSRLFGGSKK